MVKVAIAGGSGEVAQEVIDALLTSNNHEILILSRKDASGEEAKANLSWAQVDYADKERLTKVLQGVNTLLSFITPQTDPGSQAQKNLIDASIDAGVKRFAPSEWATSSVEYMEWYAGKAEIRDYLETVNLHEKVLEYTLFQPGLFLNYFTHPHRSSRHVNTFQTQFDFENRRAIVPDGYEHARITLTTSQDLANIVVKAIEYDKEWPIVGGIQGCTLSIAELLQLGEEIRGGRFTVDKLKVDDLKAGIVRSSWFPKVSHPAIPAEQAESLAQWLLAGMTLGIATGGLNVSDEWNRLIPDYTFTQPYQFLFDAWKGKQ